MAQGGQCHDNHNATIITVAFRDKDCEDPAKLGGYLALFGEAEDAFPDFFGAWTWSFGTKDASGSTLQAANVIDALKSGALALLVDEDVSAENFMARDGRMRVMITDKPITPLLYSVNSLFLSKEQGASTVIMCVLTCLPARKGRFQY